MFKAFLFAAALTACADLDDDSLDPDDGELIDEAPQPSISNDGEDIGERAGCTITVNQKSELMITDLAVVEDAVRTKWTGSLATASDGAWHFGRLMTEMAGANDPEAFVRTWLNQWAAPRTVNGQVVPARPISQVLSAWPKLASGKLDLTKPPLRLLAIVNRFDLRSPGNAGEGRFVFGVLDGAGNPQQFTVILEYKLPAANAAAVATWAADWHELGTLARGSAPYRTKLQQITRKFARRDAAPSRPNGSAISQVRTNEIALAFPWELREFHLTTTGQLRMSTLAQTPANGFDSTSALASYMTANATAIKAQTHVVPATFQGQPFAAPNILNNIDFWNAPGITDNTLRFRFSLNTCNGCHGAETSTGFLHVNPRARGQEAQLSGFLTGETIQDPVVPSTSRTLNDLRRRANGFRDFLCAP
jgi:hypothetical protein